MLAIGDDVTLSWYKGCQRKGKVIEITGDLHTGYKPFKVKWYYFSDTDPLTCVSTDKDLVYDYSLIELRKLDLSKEEQITNG